MTGCQLFRQETEKTNDPLLGNQPANTAAKGVVPPPAEPGTFTSNATAAMGDLQGGRGLGFGGTQQQQTPAKTNWQKQPGSDWSSTQPKSTNEAKPKPGEVQLGPISPGGKQPVPVYKSSNKNVPAPNPAKVAKVSNPAKSDTGVVQTGGVTVNSTPQLKNSTPQLPQQKTLPQMNMDELVAELKKYGVLEQTISTTDKGKWMIVFTRNPTGQPNQMTISTVEGNSPTEAVRRAVDLLSKQK